MVALEQGTQTGVAHVGFAHVEFAQLDQVRRVGEEEQRDRGGLP